MTSLVDVFERLIEDDWKLEHKDADWLIREENKTANPEMRITGVKAVGFSLDQRGKNPWPFLANLAGVKKVCDAILVARIEDIHYVIAVEMKSGNTNKAPKQIASAHHFVEWLRGLLRLHDHWKDGWTFCGLISASPRKTERKGTSRRKLDMSVSRSRGYAIATIRNQRRLNLIDFHRELSAL